MPPATKSPAAPVPYAMPKPSPVVVWRNAPNGDPTFAIVTKFGKSAVSLMLFPPDSRAGIPRDGVRHVGDPQCKVRIDSDSGVWDFTDETKALRILAGISIPGPDGNPAVLTPDDIAFVNRVTK